MNSLYTKVYWIRVGRNSMIAWANLGWCPPCVSKIPQKHWAAIPKRNRYTPVKRGVIPIRPPILDNFTTNTTTRDKDQVKLRCAILSDSEEATGCYFAQFPKNQNIAKFKNYTPNPNFFNFPPIFSLRSSTNTREDDTLDKNNHSGSSEPSR